MKQARTNPKKEKKLYRRTCRNKRSFLLYSYEYHLRLLNIVLIFCALPPLYNIPGSAFEIDFILKLTHLPNV